MSETPRSAMSGPVSDDERDRLGVAIVVDKTWPGGHERDLADPTREFAEHDAGIVCELVVAGRWPCPCAMTPRCPDMDGNGWTS